MLFLTTDPKYTLFIPGDTAQISLPLGGTSGSPWGECLLPCRHGSYLCYDNGQAVILTFLSPLSDYEHLILFSRVVSDRHRVDRR